MTDFPVYRGRLRFLGGLGLLSITLLAGCGRPGGGSSTAAKDYWLYVGTNVANEQENSIYLYRVDAATGAFTQVKMKLSLRRSLLVITI